MLCMLLGLGSHCSCIICRQTLWRQSWRRWRFFWWWRRSMASSCQATPGDGRFMWNLHRHYLRVCLVPCITRSLTTRFYTTNKTWYRPTMKCLNYLKLAFLFHSGTLFSELAFCRFFQVFTVSRGGYLFILLGVMGQDFAEILAELSRLVDPNHLVVNAKSWPVWKVWCLTPLGFWEFLIWAWIVLWIALMSACLHCHELTNSRTMQLGYSACSQPRRCARWLPVHSCMWADWPGLLGASATWQSIFRGRCYHTPVHGRIHVPLGLRFNDGSFEKDKDKAENKGRPLAQPTLPNARDRACATRPYTSIHKQSDKSLLPSPSLVS